MDIWTQGTGMREQILEFLQNIFVVFYLFWMFIYMYVCMYIDNNDW